MDDPSSEFPTTWMRFLRQIVRIVVGLILVGAVYGAMTVLLPYQRERRIATKVKSQGGRLFIDYDSPNWIPRSIRNRLPVFDRIVNINIQSSDSPLTTDLVADIASLPGLESVFIGDSNLNERFIAIWKLKRPDDTSSPLVATGSSDSVVHNNLFEAVVQGSKITVEEIENLKELPRLCSLTLDCPQMGDTCLKHLDRLKNLKVLKLRRQLVTDAGIEYLKDLTNLVELDLSGSNITDSGLARLTGLTNLVRLDLHQTQTTPQGRAQFRKALPQCAVALKLHAKTFLSPLLKSETVDIDWLVDP